MTTLYRLARAGVEVLVAAPADGMPSVVYWGGDLGPASRSAHEGLLAAWARPTSFSALDDPWPLTLLPAEPDGWQGRPGIAGQHAGAILRPRWQVDQIDATGDRLEVTAAADGLHARVVLHLDGGGVLVVTMEIRNTAEVPLELTSLEATMPVADVAQEVLDLTGRWTRERAPQRRALVQGSWVRESRRGRTGHDAPLLLALGTAGFSAEQGEIWAVHPAWSSDAVYRHDALPESSTVLGAGALLRPGEIVLGPGESFTTPPVMFIFSDSGLDGIGDRMHASLRAEPVQQAARVSPVTLNTWEAVYFDHDVTRLFELAEVAASIGVERFVLDDGWFLGRRDDSSGLGDWVVDPDVWPEGLRILADRVHGLGMEFGLWFEPEMISPDSQVARAHPEWLLPAWPHTLTWRNQHLIDLTQPAAFSHVLEHVSAVVAAAEVDYIKWDHNRDLLEAVSGGRARVVEQTRAGYALMEEVRARHPGLEIESCASGGGRIDRGVLTRAERVWASDTNDPIERADIQRWTELLLPPEVIGAHVGPAAAHTTGRTTSLDLRIAVALVGSFGLEWDITRCSQEELGQLRRAIAGYRRLRPLLHGGLLRHPRAGDTGLQITQVLAPDGSAAVVRVVRTVSGLRSLPPLQRIGGLQPTQHYRVRPVPELDLPPLGVRVPQWLEHGVVMSGAALERFGVRLPPLAPGQAIVLEVVAEESALAGPGA